MSACFLEVEQISKNFGRIEALKTVSLTANLGEVLAIVGDNGAGKSTLIKMLAGSLKPDQGKITIEGKTYKNLTPKLALKAGLATVYQDLALINNFNISENIFLGRELFKMKFLLNKKAMLQRAEQLLADLNVNIPSCSLPVKSLSGGQRQGVAIARAVDCGGKMLIFDEPTAAMGLRETASILQTISNLAKQGYGVIIISHNLQQVMEISQRICIMRQGQIVDIVETKNVTGDLVVSLITGTLDGLASKA